MCSHAVRCCSSPSSAASKEAQTLVARCAASGATDGVSNGSVSCVQDLANHAASLNSTRGAAFGFASIAKLAGEQLKPYVDKVVPKLYRCALCHTTLKPLCCHSPSTRHTMPWLGHQRKCL